MQKLSKGAAKKLVNCVAKNGPTPYLERSQQIKRQTHPHLLLKLVRPDSRSLGLSQRQRADA
jgi:hypothetical protein